MKQNLILIFAATIALAAGLYSYPPEQTKAATARLEFSLPDPSGKIHSVSEWAGKILIINFWATWCPPCLKEIPAFIQFQQESAEKGIQFIGIAVEERGPVVEYLKTVKINYPILIGGDEGITLSQQLGNIINTIPFTVIVNRQGKVIHRQLGELSIDTLNELLASMSPESP